MILYYFFRSVEYILFLLPRPWRKAFFLGLAKLAYAVDRKHRLVVRQNLLFAYDKAIDETRIDRITRYCYRNLMLNFFQVLENRRLTPEEQSKYVTFENREYVDDARKAGRPVIIVSAHFGNWELGATAIAANVVPLTSIHKALSNPWFNRYLLESRSRYRMDMVEKSGAVKYLTRTLRNGGSVSLMIDQNINPKESVIVDFFGHQVTQTSAPAFLARKFNAVIAPVFIHTTDEKHYTLRFETPLEVRQTDDAAADVLSATQALSDVVEALIRQEPEFWFWCHRRWKTFYPEIYGREP